VAGIIDNATFGAVKMAKDNDALKTELLNIYPELYNSPIFDAFAKVMGSQVKTTGSSDMTPESLIDGYKDSYNIPPPSHSPVFGNAVADIIQTSPRGGTKALKADNSGYLSVPIFDVDEFVPKAVKMARALKDMPVQSQFKA
jgi:hypothetical protein